MGDSRYTTKRSFDVYEGAATNENGVAGAFAAGGIGIGAAMNVGNSMMLNIGNPMQQIQTSNCASCGAQIPINSKFCPECGYRETKKECTGCHTLIPAGSRFCPECGFDNCEIICECGKKLPPGTKFCPECGKRV